MALRLESPIHPRTLTGDCQIPEPERNTLCLGIPKPTGLGVVPYTVKRS